MTGITAHLALQAYVGTGTQHVLPAPSRADFTEVLVPKLWSEVQSILMEKASREEAYRRRLLEDPVGVAEEESGVWFPEAASIQVIETDPDSGYVPLPRNADSGELPDSALENVAGGADSTGQTSSSQYFGITLPRGGWDGNHIETMRRPVKALR